jgi:hypothetical protein
MHRYGIEEEVWFEAARTGLERRGFKLRVQPRSIIIDKEARLPRIVASAREFLEFAERQGLRIDAAAFAEADRYGDGRSDLTGRYSASPFETPPAGMEAPDRRYDSVVVAEAPRRAEVSAVETRLAELRQEQDRQASERNAINAWAREKTELEERCAGLEGELVRLSRMLTEAEQQRDLYQLSSAAAEDRLRLMQADLESMPVQKGGVDKRFDQLRRFLARELHPDLARADTPERTVREALFKRVWAKIEQLQ